MEDTSLFEQVLEWIRQQKPLYLRVTDYVGFAVEQNWPIISTWSVHFARLFMWVSALWLDCSLRGLRSLLQLSSTAYFLLLWCSFLSMTAISGLLYVIVSSGIACLAGLILGFAPAIFIMAVLGATMLWMYGSFWITGALIIIGGSLFTLNHTQLAILITTVYSMYCAKVRGGWLGLFLCMNMAFISNDILIHLMKVSVEDAKECFDDQAEESKRKNFCNEHGSTGSNGEQRKSSKSRPTDESLNGQFSNGEQRKSSKSIPTDESSNGEQRKSSKSRPTDESSNGQFSNGEQRKSSKSRPTDESSNGQFVQKREELPTSKPAEAAASVGDEVLRIISSSDYYATLGLSRYEKIDFTVLKQKYRKKAMLVHPDKNLGNPVAEESFKKLQSAYEVLSDVTKKNTYDVELRTEEMTRGLHQDFQRGVPKGMNSSPYTQKATFHENSTVRGKKTANESSRRHKGSGHDSVYTDLDELEQFVIWMQNSMAPVTPDDFDLPDWFSEFQGTGSFYYGKQQKRKAKRNW